MTQVSLNPDYLGSSFQNQLEHDLLRGGNRAKTAKEIGGSLHHIEQQLLAEVAKPNAEEGKVKALELKYQKALRAWTLFSELMRNMHEILMAGIRNLRLG